MVATIFIIFTYPKAIIRDVFRDLITKSSEQSLLQQKVLETNQTTG